MTVPVATAAAPLGATPGRRCGAMLIDALIQSIVSGLLVLIAVAVGFAGDGTLGQLLVIFVVPTLLVGVAYLVWLWVAGYTPGYKILGIWMRRPDGSAPGVRSLLWYLLWGVLSSVFVIIPIILLFATMDRSRRCWMDRVADVVVADAGSSAPSAAGGLTAASASPWGSAGADTAAAPSQFAAPEQGQFAAPGFGQPVQAAPAFGQPAEAAPAFGQPVEAAPAFGQPVEAAPAFGQPAPAAPSAPDAGQVPAFGQPPAPAFGQPVEAAPAFGQPAEAAPAFGQPVEAAPAFGQPVEAAPAFGQPAPAAPSAPAAGQVPAFGQPPAPAFGQPAEAAPAFGQPPAEAAPAFGQPVEAAPVFGQPAPAAPSAPAAGQVPGFDQPPAPAFGQPVEAAPAFGQPPAEAAPAFGQPAEAAPAFGQPPAEAAPAFGQPPAPAFGQPAEAAPAFGQPPAEAAPAFGQPVEAAPAFGQPAPAAPSAPDAGQVPGGMITGLPTPTALASPEPATQSQAGAIDERTVVRARGAHAAHGPWTLVSDTQQVIELREGRTLLGRAPMAAQEWADALTVAVKDPATSVSKTHLGVVLTGDTLTVCDLGSTNGSALILDNGAEMPLTPHASVTVPEGASLRIGDRVLHVAR